ncbi:pollen-specific leucine-rich repeat extensin-like protein 3 [Anoplophora glabripennis]|uniref:pollen-specific leucine-rich repeat extensin-like protein 3 n=1 Tax=Anoplophora glabripennis TaxID=217634 RepID=UPI000873DE5E|nr:pollen-specific leucine-rich repeat extensin-like protein 3 [Anoplophora glabripennis]XP_018575597.1 pollen-specific leucine-rich repeat extensin-like protein 3 [Anoplophora glabripennis]
MYESKATPRPPCPPGLPPPPGFFPLNSFPHPGNFVPTPPNYANMPCGPPRPMCYYPPQVMPNTMPPPWFPPVFNNQNSQNTNVSCNAPCQSTSAPPSSVGGVNEQRDFYDVYNEQLRQRVNHSSQ